MSKFQTIVAPITAPGKAGVAVVRVSGPETREIVKKLCAKSDQVLNNPRQLVLSEVFDFSGEKPETLDFGMVCFFRSPKSFTGEDIAEFQIHGSPFLVGKLLENITACGVRLARAGEFSERAFLNGQIDLSQAEAIADLVSAESSAQARVAKEQLSGKLSSAISDLGEPLRDTLAEIEAFIDFPDEDIPPLSAKNWLATIDKVEKSIDAFLESFRTGRLYREGASVVLCGIPNAGKSSILNRLVGEERAIVTAIPGTTRDSIEERISLDGLYLKLWDTAGLVEENSTRAVDEVEKLGIERSWKKAETADLIVFIFDPLSPVENQKDFFLRAKKLDRPIMFVVNKNDLVERQNTETKKIIEENFSCQAIFISANSGFGFPEFKSALKQELLGAEQNNSSILITTRRHFDALKSAKSALQQTTRAITENLDTELISFELRTALTSLNEIIGATPTEDILGRIFSKFCIGK